MNKLRKLIISRFVDLQTLMGESYKEGITIDEINTFLSDKKFADLSTGAYVDKNKYEADIKAKDNEIKQYKETIKSKMSDDEQKLESEKEKVRLHQRILLSSVVELKVDNANRVLIPSKTLKQYGINKDVIIVGVLDHFEIWDNEKWKKYQEMNESSFELDAEAILKNEE